jgi:ankyrin repeat protein
MTRFPLISPRPLFSLAALCALSISASASAAMQGKKEAVALLLDQGAALEHQDAEGNTALLFAVVNRHATVTGLLVERGANAAHVNRHGAFPLCYLRSEPIAAALLQKPIHLQQQSEQRSTALINASADGECKIVTMLLDHGADIDFCDRKGVTALAAAIRDKRHDVMKLLLDRRADPGCTMRTPGALRCSMLGFAANRNDIAAMQLLVQAGADVDQCAKETLSPLYVASRSNSKEAVQWLLEKNASIDLAAGDGMTALMVSAQKGHVKIVELLLQHFGLTGLLGAVQYGKEECAALLLKNGASLKEKTGDGRFPLHLAAENGHEKTIELLLDHGADINPPDEKSRTALIYAATNGHLSALKFLLEKNADSTARNRYGWSALHCAAGKGKDEVIAELLKQPGSEIDCRDNNGLTALHLAAFHGHYDAVHRLLDNGANACKVDVSGWHALHMAAFNGHIAVVETLISTESNMKFMDYPDKDGCTPLLVAARQGKADVVRLLAEHGASLLVRDKFGRTALHHAAAIGHANVAEVLLAKMTPLLQASDVSWPVEVSITEAFKEAITAGHAGVVEVLLRSQPLRASLPFEWNAHPVIADLRNHVYLVIEPQQGNNDQPGQFPGLDDGVARFGSLLELTAATHDDGATMGLNWQASIGSCAVIAKKLQESAKGINTLQRTLAGPESQVWPAQTRLVAAGLLASLGESSIFNTPYSGKQLSPGVEACFNKLALHQAHLLAQAGGEAEQGLATALGNLHGTCMASFAGKPFHQVNLYLYLTRECGLYDIPAKRISDAFAEIWLQHKQSGTTVRERALAQALAERSRNREVLQQIAHDSALSGNEVTFHWLLNRQLDLVNAWHKKVLGTANQ